MRGVFTLTPNILDGRLLAVYQPDDDQDGLSNAAEDVLGSNPANVDSDGDGLRDLDEWYQAGTDARDADTDGDGVLDGTEYAAGTDPLSAATYPGDGDVNADGAVNAGDLVLVMQIAIGQEQLKAIKGVSTLFTPIAIDLRPHP